MPPRKRTLTAERVTGEVTLTETANERREPMCVCDAYGGCPQGCPRCPVCWGDAAETWARLTAPLEHYQVPVVFTPADRAADDDYRDHLRARAHTDRADVREWHAQAREAVFGPCRDPLLRLP